MNYDTEMTVLYRLIENKEWDAVVERLDTNPEEASKFVEKYTPWASEKPYRVLLAVRWKALLRDLSHLAHHHIFTIATMRHTRCV